MSEKERRAGYEGLIGAVNGLRSDISAYRWTLERQLKRGTQMFVVVIAMLALLLVAAVGATFSALQAKQVASQVEKSQVQRAQYVEDHRIRNELLHSCLVELVFAIITTSREERAQLTNPCPEPIDIPPEDVQQEQE